jgi:hypothetical protein
MPLWTTFSSSGALQVGAGAAAGAAIAFAMLRGKRSRFALATFSALVCVGAGVLTMVELRWSHVPVLWAVGLIGAAAPITLALTPPPDITTVSDAMRYLRRAAAALTIHVVYGIGFATLGFFVGLSAAAMTLT